MSTRQVLGVVGAVVGAYFGSPQLGYAIGSAIGGAVDPEVIRGPSIGDLIEQTSSEGGPRPIVFALSQPMSGNVIAQGLPRIVKKKKSQGKGGPKVETESVYRTYAVGVCEGPIGGFARIWRNGTLVYDAREGATADQNAENLKFLETARFFLGTFDQEPSPDLEALFGVGTTPAHRGTAYMVMADEDLTDLRGAIPQWTFQVTACPLEAVDFIEFIASDHEGVDDVDFGWSDGTNFFALAHGTLLGRTSPGGYDINYIQYLNFDPPSTQDSIGIYMQGGPGNYPPFDLFDYCDIYVNDVPIVRLPIDGSSCAPDPASCLDGGNVGLDLGIRAWIWTVAPVTLNYWGVGDTVRIEFFTGEDPGGFPP